LKVRTLVITSRPATSVKNRLYRVEREEVAKSIDLGDIELKTDYIGLEASKIYSDTLFRNRDLW